MTLFPPIDSNGSSGGCNHNGDGVFSIWPPIALWSKLKGREKKGGPNSVPICQEKGTKL